MNLQMLRKPVDRHTMGLCFQSKKKKVINPETKMSISLNKQYTPCPKTERGRSYHMGGDPKEGRRIVYTSGQLVILRSIDVSSYYFTANSPSQEPIGCVCLPKP